MASTTTISTADPHQIQRAISVGFSHSIFISGAEHAKIGDSQWVYRAVGEKDPARYALKNGRIIPDESDCLEIRRIIFYRERKKAAGNAKSSLPVLSGKLRRYRSRFRK